MKATFLLTAVAVLSSSVVAAPAPMHPPEEGVAAKRSVGDVTAEKRWAWTKWEDAVDAPAEKKAKRWAWTKWEDAVDAPAEKKAKRWAWTKWEDAVDAPAAETQ